MAKRVNYGQEKRQRELAKQKKKQRKQQDKQARRDGSRGAGSSQPQGRGDSHDGPYGSGGGTSVR